MFVNLEFRAGAVRPVPVVPSAAVQWIGERAIVYVSIPDDEGRFVERTVKLGPRAGELVEVLEGLRPGERVVTEGSFFVRAEAARMQAAGRGVRCPLIDALSRDGAPGTRRDAPRR